MKFLSVLFLVLSTTATYASNCENFEGRYECSDGQTIEISQIQKKNRLMIRTEKNDNILENSYSTKKMKNVKSQRNGEYDDNDGMIGHAICENNKIEIVTEDFFSEGDPKVITISKVQDNISVRALFQKIDCKGF